MTRIQPECFMEIFYSYGKLVQDENIWNHSVSVPHYKHSGYILHLAKIKPVACFQIYPTKIPLAERLEARKVNNNLKP